MAFSLVERDLSSSLILYSKALDIWMLLQEIDDVIAAPSSKYACLMTALGYKNYHGGHRNTVLLLGPISM